MYTAHRSQLHNGDREPPTDPAELKRKTWERLGNDPRIVALTTGTICVLAAAAIFSILGSFSYILAELFHHLAWLLDILGPAFYTLAWFFFYPGLLGILSTFVIVKVNKLM